MDKGLFSFVEVNTKQKSENKFIVIEESVNEIENIQYIGNDNGNFFALFIYLELNVNKNFQSLDNITIAVLVPTSMDRVNFMEEIDFKESDLKVTLNKDDITDHVYLDKREGDQVEIDISISNTLIDHYVICNEDLEMPLTTNQLTTWLDKKYQIYQKNSVAVSFYTYKLNENSYREKKYEKSLKRYRYIFKSTK